MKTRVRNRKSHSSSGNTLILGLGFLVLLASSSILGTHFYTSLDGFATMQEDAFPNLEATNEEEVHPASIPWLKTSQACEETGRVWQGNSCWDYQHSHVF